MFTMMSDPQLAALVGLAGGCALGLAARLGRFCTLGAIEDALYGGSDHRLRMWGVAIGVAIIAVFALFGTEFLEAAEIPYLSTAWNPVAHVVGGLLFGVGMAWAGNCGFGAIARLGGGDLRSFVIVLVMGISAYVVMSGPLAQLRVWLFPTDLIETDSRTGLAHAAADLTGLSPALIGILVGIGVLAAVLANRGFLAERSMIAWGAVVGLAVASGWAGTQWLATESFGAVPVQSHTFAGPIGEAILYAMTASGGTLSFAVGSVSGVWAGAFAGSLIKGHFRWEACEDPRELRRQIFGAMLMGAGAVIAVGCTVGQGISAMALLSYGAPVTLIAIFVGASIGLRTLIMGFSHV